MTDSLAMGHLLYQRLHSAQFIDVPVAQDM